MSFISDVIAGIAQVSDVDSYRKRWSEYASGTDDMTCYDFLGLTYNQYVRCMGGGRREVLTEIVEEIKVSGCY